MIPSSRNSAEAITLARKALDKHGRFWLGNPAKVEAELYNLDLLDGTERVQAVDMALLEIRPEHRLGPQPPNDFSSHPPFLREKLYAFCWTSETFQKQMYFKFALVDGEATPRLALYALHEERPNND